MKIWDTSYAPKGFVVVDVSDQRRSGSEGCMEVRAGQIPIGLTTSFVSLWLTARLAWTEDHWKNVQLKEPILFTQKAGEPYYALVPVPVETENEFGPISP